MNHQISRHRASLFSAILLLYAAAAHAQQIHWHDDYAAGRAEAQKTGKPIFLEFRCSP